MSTKFNDSKKVSKKSNLLFILELSLLGANAVYLLSRDKIAEKVFDYFTKAGRSK